MDTKAVILERALELFYTKGYDAVGVQEIADRSGITKPTLYYYFGSKYGLLESLMEVKFADFAVKLEKAADYRGDLPMTLYQVASLYLNFAVSNRKFHLLLLALFYSARENESYKAVKPIITKFYHTILTIFQSAGAELGNMNGRQNQFAIGFTGILNHYVLMLDEMQKKDTVIPNEMIFSIVHQFMYGIYS